MRLFVRMLMRLIGSVPGRGVLGCVGVCWGVLRCGWSENRASHWGNLAGGEVGKGQSRGLDLAWCGSVAYISGGAGWSRVEPGDAGGCLNSCTRGRVPGV